MGCFRQVGIGILAATLGCSASTNAPTTTATDETGNPDDETGTTSDGGTTDDTGATEDTAAPLEYPAGPYGKTVGATMPNISWEGYRDGTGEWTTISLLDYYDPDGSRGIRAIKVGAAALW